MDYFNKIITDIELHSSDGIRDCFENGVSPNDHFKNRPLIYELITEYKRGLNFKKCVRLFYDYGLKFEDKFLLAVLMDDEISLGNLLAENPDAINKRYTLDCAFTQLYEVSLLHICAEYNHSACAGTLIRHGENVNVKAGTDEYGMGGQTPVFHTVNQNSNFSIDMMKYLIKQSADLTIPVKGLVWGKGYEWETFIPSVNPISYAMMGLLPQFQRTEVQIYEVVSILLKAAYDIDYKPSNVPNKYLER